MVRVRVRVRIAVPHAVRERAVVRVRLREHLVGVREPADGRPTVRPQINPSATMNGHIVNDTTNAHGPSPLELVQRALSQQKQKADAVADAAAAAADKQTSTKPAYSNAAAEALFGEPIAKLLVARAKAIAARPEHRDTPRAAIADLARKQLRDDYEAAVGEKAECTEALARDFKRWLGVLPGEYQRRVEKQLRADRPKASDKEIRQRAAGLVREHLERADLKWKLFIADDKMAELLQRAADRGDAEADQLLRRFQRVRARLQNQSADDRKAALTMIETLEKHRELIRERVRDEMAQLRAWVDGDAHNTDADHVSPDAGVQATTTPATAATDEKLARNALDEPLHPHVNPATEFLRAHQRDRSESANSASQRLVDAVTEELHASVAVHLRFAATADIDALFPRPAGGGVDGKRPNGSVGDLIALLESTHGQPAAPTSEYSEHYLNEWRRVVVRDDSANTTRFDNDIALASRHRAGDKDFIEIFMQEYGLSHADAAAAVATGINPERSEVLRAFRWATQDNWFRETLHQVELSAEQRINNLRQNIARAEKRRRAEEREGAGAQQSPSPTASSASPTGTTTTGDEKIDAQIRAAGNRKLFAEQYFSRASLQYQAARKLPIVRLAHLPDFWRRAVPERKERPCAQGVTCVCMLEDNAFVRGASAASLRGKRMSQRFICREFLTEEELQNFQQFGKLDFPPRMCYFCELFTTTCEVLRRDCDRESSAMLIQRFGVEIGPGGVDPDACLPLEHAGRPTGIVRPLPRFDWCNYEFATTEVGEQIVPCIVVLNLDFRLGSENGMPT